MHYGYIKIFYLNKRKQNDRIKIKNSLGMIIIVLLQKSVWQHHWPLPEVPFCTHIVDTSLVTLNENDVFYFILN